jgi:hypothetical protein
LFDVSIAFRLRLLGFRGHGRFAVGGDINGHGIHAKGGLRLLGWLWLWRMSWSAVGVRPCFLFLFLQKNNS